MGKEGERTQQPPVREVLGTPGSGQRAPKTGGSDPLETGHGYPEHGVVVHACQSTPAGWLGSDRWWCVDSGESLVAAPCANRGRPPRCIELLSSLPARAVPRSPVRTGAPRKAGQAIAVTMCTRTCRFRSQYLHAITAHVTIVFNLRNDRFLLGGRQRKVQGHKSRSPSPGVHRWSPTSPRLFDA